MSLLDSIKDKIPIIHKPNDSYISDVRSHVVGDEDFGPPVPPRPMEDQMGPPPEPPYQDSAPPGFGAPPGPASPPPIEPLPPMERQASMPPSPEPMQTPGPDYSGADKEDLILDEIRFLKSEMSAIKSQIDAVNERLKNMQRQGERRY